MLSDQQTVLIGLLAELRACGWTFVAINADDTTEVDALFGAYFHPTCVDTLHVRSESESHAARLRGGQSELVSRKDVLWTFTGPLVDAIAHLVDLPEPDTRTAPNLARSTSGLWLP
ncbi:hypothetical protein [Actinokineospora sp.]|uniref:hypothetical protein n=1 Tax=Actinokineospora sp. TaxID=1872133 RepID=UPI004037762E